MPELPTEIWAHIFDLLETERVETERAHAAISIQAHYKGFKVRIGPLRWVLRYIRKGRLINARALYHAQQMAT